MVVLRPLLALALGGSTLVMATSADPGGVTSDARLRLRPNDGEVGEVVTARGRGFAFGEAGDLYWVTGELQLVDFLADDDGNFEVQFAVPDVEPGVYEVAAIGESTAATIDEFEVTVAEAADSAATASVAPPPSLPAAPVPPVVPASMADADVTPADNSCDSPGVREVAVADAAGLEAALADAQPGDRITMGDGVYPGNFVAALDGAADARISLCGGRGAVIDGGDWGASGYALHLQGDHWTVSGITVTNAQKGVMADGVTGVVLDGIEVHTTGHEAIHFRTGSTDNVVQNSDIHDTGLDNEKFGEGVYLGTAVSNWPRYTDGQPDRSDRNRVLYNRIWNTSSESVDVKEGTEGGVIAGNVFDGGGLSGADSWVDVKGSGYLIVGNLGTASTQDGFQTHVIDDMEWGSGNVFAANTATVDGPGVGFYIHQPDESANVVQCDNVVNGADGGFTNLESGCNG